MSGSSGMGELQAASAQAEQSMIESSMFSIKENEQNQEEQAFSSAANAFAKDQTSS